MSDAEFGRAPPSPRSAACAAIAISGHRGARGLWPENTLAGFARTARLGVDAIEFDVVLTADDVPVVTHDLRLNPDLARDAAGRWIEAPGPAVRALTLAALQRFDLGRARPGSTTAQAFPEQQAIDGERVPTLAAVLELLTGYPVRLELELKTDPASPVSPEPDHLAALVLAAVEAGGAGGQVTLRSFDWRGLAAVARRRPAMPLCFLSYTADTAMLLCVQEAAGGHPAEWAPRAATLTREVVAAAQNAGVTVKPWTVNDPEEMQRLIGWGVDGFCTDRPDLARHLPL